jgi:hypothetical protein
MFSQANFKFFQGNSFSDLFAQDIENESCALILNYPATAKWAAYPNVQKYFLQDGSSEATKTSFDKICQKEPWKNLAVLGDTLPGVVISPPQKLLVKYWQEHFGFRNRQLEMMDCSTYLDDFQPKQPPQPSDYAFSVRSIAARKTCRQSRYALPLVKQSHPRPVRGALSNLSNL